MNTFSFCLSLLRTLRPRQWIKNFALFAGIIFSEKLDDPNALLKVMAAFLIFCAISSATYIINDIFDVERDKLHPLKKNRPIAAGIISIPLAATIAIGIIVIILPLAYTLSPSFFLAVLGYLFLQGLYSSYLKSVMLLDVISIAAGFVLRVYAGIWVIQATLSSWFLLCVISFALFLAIGKRRSELTLLQSKASEHRQTLLHYPDTLLDIYTTMFATATWLTYALFTFLQTQETHARPRIVILLNNLKLPFAQGKYLMITIPIVIYAVMRYLYIIYEKKEGESPEKVLLTDLPLLTSVIIWLIMVIGIVYYFGV